MKKSVKKFVMNSKNYKKITTWLRLPKTGKV